MPNKIGEFTTSYMPEAKPEDAHIAPTRAQGKAKQPAKPDAAAADGDFKLRVDPNNYRQHPDNNKRLIKRSLRENGAGRSIVVDNTGASIGGSGVLEQAEELGLKKRIVETDGTELVVVVRKDIAPDDPRRKKLALADNATTDQSVWDIAALQNAFTADELASWEVELPEVDVQGDLAEAAKDEAHAKLADKFLIPPFSVLDTRRGEWADRKRAWNALIGDNGESREDKLGIESITCKDNKYGINGFNSVSILDAVLAEIICMWFTPKGKCSICDPFAGDSVFGFVSSYLGHRFTGIELRKEQAQLNNDRVQGMDAKYICDDGQNIAKHIEHESQDLVFSCPPYFDLEHYSDLPNDASNQKEYSGFLQILDNALTGAVGCLKNNRFAVVVMSNVRGGKDGAYYDICSDITRIMQRNGLYLYNEIILLNLCGTAQIRAAHQMKNRKVVRIHQEVLVYYKGDSKAIKDEYPEIEVAEIESADV